MKCDNSVGFPESGHIYAQHSSTKNKLSYTHQNYKKLHKMWHVYKRKVCKLMPLSLIKVGLVGVQIPWLVLT